MLLDISLCLLQASNHGGCGLAHELDTAYSAPSKAIQTTHKEQHW